MIKTISLHHISNTPPYLSKVIWQELFNYYRSQDGNLNQMNDFLCDLSELERLIEAGTPAMYWDFDKEKGYTNLSDFYLPYHVKIEINYSSEIKITFPD